jgi:hypothetical protein
MVTVEQEAKDLVTRELGNAGAILLAKGIKPTSENLLHEFKECVEKMLADNLRSIRELCDSTKRREDELLMWLNRVHEMISALTTYKQHLDSKNVEFLEKASELFLKKVQQIVTPNYN